MKIILMTVFILVIAGCSSTSGVLQMGPDTYTLSVGASGTGSISGNDARAKKDALVEANQFCSSKGKQILVQNSNMKSTIAGSTSELIFQCIDNTDTNRPVYRKEPNLIIENR
jgi:uncharacterized lipoprotein YmbA